MLGGVDTAGVGWAAGVDRLSLMINEEFANKPDLVLMAVSENLEPLLMPIMKKLVDFCHFEFMESNNGIRNINFKAISCIF